MATEGKIRALADAGDIDGAATAAIATYGRELSAYCRAIARDDDLAAEAFSAACEQLWRGLPGFRWDASMRTWAYQITRRALHHLRRAPSRRAERNIPLSLVTSIADAVRTPTAAHQRTEHKRGLRALRDALAPEDHELLVLRLDRKLSWKDIARALADDPAEPRDGDSADDDDVTTRAAALRKRYERVKAQLRDLAIAKGLLGSSDTDRE